MGDADAAIAAEPVPDAPFEKVPVYKEELVIIAAAGHPPICSARDVRASATLVFEQGCPWRGGSTNGSAAPATSLNG